MSEDLPELPADGEPPATEADADSWHVPWANETTWDAHWAADPGAAGWSRERRMLALDFAAAIRKTGSLMQVMSQAAADIIGVNATDLNCLNILSFSGSLTAGELAKATGLTTASITGVVDRLESAGFVTRERDPNDRRRVVVSLVLEKAVGEVAPVFAPMVADWQTLARGYSDDELQLIVNFYGQMEQVIRKHLARLREQQQ
jgi:DNA-binding MarR family transcriptional regulator